MAHFMKYMNIQREFFIAKQLDYIQSIARVLRSLEVRKQ